jgi:hypothetical protein
MITQADVILARILVKTERAKKHLFDVEALARDSRKGIGGLPYTKGQRRGQSVPLRIVSIDVITGAGDVIHNLRSALDHLAWELAKWKTGEPRKPRNCCFPIGRDFENYKSVRAGGAVAGMSPEATKAIDDLCPYKDGAAISSEPLWRIHHLDIVDKHRHLLIAGFQIRFTDTGLPGIWGTVQDEPTHFLGLFEDDFHGEEKRSPQPTAVELEVFHMKPLIPSLHELLVFTENLIENFKPFLGLRK